MAILRLEPPVRHQGLSLRDEDCLEKVLDGRCVEHHHRYRATRMEPREIRGIARFARRVVPVDQVVRCKDELSSRLLPARRLAGLGIELRPSFAVSQARLPQRPPNTGISCEAPLCSCFVRSSPCSTAPSLHEEVGHAAESTPLHGRDLGLASSLPRTSSRDARRLYSEEPVHESSLEVAGDRLVLGG
jgi:hypothetical protein